MLFLSAGLESLTFVPELGEVTSPVPTLGLPIVSSQISENSIGIDELWVWFQRLTSGQGIQISFESTTLDRRAEDEITDESREIEDLHNDDGTMRLKQKDCRFAVDSWSTENDANKGIETRWATSLTTFFVLWFKSSHNSWNSKPFENRSRLNSFRATQSFLRKYARIIWFWLSWLVFQTRFVVVVGVLNTAYIIPTDLRTPNGSDYASSSKTFHVRFIRRPVRFCDFS